MRLQLIWVVACLLEFSNASAQESDKGHEVTTRVLVYSDDDATTVTTSTVDAEANLAGNTSIGVHALVDAISSASVDVISAATGRWDEKRVEVGARGGVVVSDVNLNLGYTRSQENDWLSNAFSVSASKELFQRNTVVSASYGLTLNSVGRASDPNFERSLDSHSGEVGISQLLDKKTRVGGAYTLQALSGFLASPYRYVPVVGGTRLPERHPDSRFRHSLSGYVVRSLAKDWAGRFGYRFYNDDWGVNSHTATLRVAYEVSDWLFAGVEGRAYLQNSADFYRGNYDTIFQYMSFDRELADFWDAGGTVDLAVTFGPLTADARFGLIYYKFDNFPALKNRTAIVAGGGARLDW